MDEFQDNYDEWKPIPKDFILCYSIYITSLKWQNHRNIEQISVSQGFKEGVRAGRVWPIKRQHELLWWWKHSIYWLHQCQYPGHDTELQFCRKLPSGKLSKEHLGSLYDFLKQHINLQSSQIKSNFLNN